jgi:hypothetical protein
MCNVDKIWSVLSHDKNFAELFPGDESRGVVRTMLVEATPTLLAACLDKPVTFASFVEAHAAVLRHLADASDFGKMLFARFPGRDLSDAQAQREIGSYREAVRWAAASLERFAACATVMPQSDTSDDVKFTRDIFRKLGDLGVDMSTMTIRELVEQYPVYVYRLAE